MAELLTLTTPEVTTITVTDWRVIGLSLQWEQALILVQVRGSNGERREFRYEGAVATTMMTALNKADLPTKSLIRRILERLVADGKFAGAVAGTPD
jgi:hypothetical protein